MDRSLPEVGRRMISTSRSPASTRRRHPDTGSERQKFRPDIEGLRAFAVLSVVLYHANLLGVSGGYIGVDVFFVISGFLITRQLLQTVGQRGVRAMPTFYTRRIRRLLPASATVVVATLVATRIWAPALEIHGFTVDGIFTTFYGLNYRLAVEGTQYLNAAAPPSPFQHYWSLAVEEQFYFCWPILIATVAFVGRRYRDVLLTAVLLVAGLISFRYSVTLTHTDQPWAYFSLLTRVWELALGAVVAVGAVWLAQMPSRLASAGAWLGLVAVVASAFVFTNSTAYPGYAVALPVVGAAVVIACGCGGRLSTDRILGAQPAQFLGRMSYSWYLWHWPMLIIAPMALGHALTWYERVVVVVVSLGAAVFSYYVVENPARSFSMANPQWFAAGAMMSATVIVVAVVILSNLPSTTGKGAAVTVTHNTSGNAQVLASMQAQVAAGLLITEAPRNLTPQPAKAQNDEPPSQYDGCHAALLQISQGPCVFGDPNGKYTVVLFGDSHMQQWQPAFDTAGEALHWRVVNWTKSACPPQEMTVVDSELKRTYYECNTWRAQTLRRIAALKPNLVVLTGVESIDLNVSPTEFADATAATLGQLQETTSAKLVYIEDTPNPGMNVPDCIVAHLADVKACNIPLSKAYTALHPALARAVRSVAGVTLVNPQPWMCTATLCPAIVGNLMEFRDEAHLSVEFATWLTPHITDLLLSATPKPA